MMVMYPICKYKLGHILNTKYTWIMKNTDLKPRLACLKSRLARLKPRLANLGYNPARYKQVIKMNLIQGI